jgi:hypothetical protein
VGPGGSPRILKGHQGLSPAQVSRAALFAAEVEKELAVEIRRRRCRAQAGGYRLDVSFARKTMLAACIREMRLSSG